MQIKTYPIPKEIKKSADYRVRVTPAGSDEFVEVDVYNATVAQMTYSTTLDHCHPDNYDVDQMSFCSFYSDFEKPVSVEITNLTGYGRDIEIRPLNNKIPVSYSNNVVRFFLDRPRKISVEFDGDLIHNLFLFAENMPEKAPDKNDGNVVYFPAGVHDAGEIVLHEGQTLYLEGGAYVYGKINCADADNITICGPGILSGAKWSHVRGAAGRGCLSKFERCNNLTIKDVIFLDSQAWTVVPIDCENVNITNMKQISYFDNSDGFDVVGCRNMLVENCFLRVFDDCVSLKSWGADNRNITFKNCIFWNDAAHAMLVGPESAYGQNCRFEDILFENITVLFTQETNPTFMGAMALMCADSAVFRNITFRNIYIERLSYGKLFFIKYSKAYATDYGTSIENVLLENIYFNGMLPLKNTIEGIDENHTVNNVKIRNFYFNGRPFTGPNNYVEANEFTQVTYEVGD